jgi:hypothetical protein
MKFHLVVLSVILSLTLAACSMAKDITPPPGYQSPTDVPTISQSDQSPKSTPTSEPTTATPESTPTETRSINPSDNFDSTPNPSLINIDGKLENGSGGNIPEGQKITLVGFDKDQSGNYQMGIELEAVIESDGSYKFKDLDAPLDRAFLIITSWGGVEYQSEPVIVTEGGTDLSVPITIYEKTDDPTVLSINQVHLFLNSSSQDIIQVTEIFIVTNPSNKVVVVSSDGTSIPFIHTPENATGVQYQLSQGSTQLLNATGGFAMLPGADKQYGFIASFTMPYAKSLKYEETFSLPVSSLTVLFPVGMRLRSDQLIDAGTQDIEGQQYQMYQTNNLASGSSLSLTLSGKPGDSTGFTLDRQTKIIIGIGVVGLVLIGVGIYLYFHDRARFKKENEVIQDQIEADALGEDHDNIIDAIVALDDQYTAGEISKDAYTMRRNELKDRLRGIL